MQKLFLAAGVAVMAMTVPALADPGKNEGGKGRNSQVQRGGGGGGDFKKARAQRSEQRKKVAEQRVERGKKASEQRFEQRRKFAEQRSEGAKKAREQRFEQAKKANERRFKAQKRVAEQRSKGREKLFEERAKRAEQLAGRSREVRSPYVNRDREVRIAMADWDDLDRWEDVRSRAYDCPPGLAKKNNGCLPPGQAKKLMGSALPAAYASSLLPERLRDYYRDDDDYYYRYGDGYVYRVDRDNDLVSALLPLFGGSYALGQPFPVSNGGYDVPGYYQSFYPDTAQSYYRYDDGYLYEIDRGSGLIDDVMPMLGYGYGVGEMLPAGYSAYNVPYQYRDMYYDTDQYAYRYAPGAIYQVDRDTSLITSVASLLTGTPMGVGQQLPMGYDAYNVPYTYRDQYYDTDDNWYRYANGNIYQVDPTTRLITAVIDAIV